jgi:hypothetical protein
MGTHSSKLRIPAHPETRDPLPGPGHAELGGPAMGRRLGFESARPAIPAAGAKVMMGAVSLRYLDSFRRGELSAVGTYEIAIQRLAASSHLAVLRDALESHRHRAEALRAQIRLGGGTASEGPGLSGAFAKLYEGGMSLFGEKVAIAALESGEDRGLADLRRVLPDLDAVSREFVDREILPEQLRTHRLLSDLRRSV